jgi:multidrug efflux system membrane fusion protein
MRRVLSILVVLTLAAGGGGYWWFGVHTPGQREGRGRGVKDPIPVVVATAEQKTVPIYLDALGTAQASATVTIKPMVDGPLVEVRFKEGQDVHAGDVLARIDPRTFQASLDQATAKKKQDEATLANARVDLVRYTKLAATAYTSAQQADTQKALVAQLEAQVAGDQAQIDQARTQLSYTTITAPVDGRVGIRQVDEGNIVHSTDVNGLVVLTTLKPISVLFTLPQQALAPVTNAMQGGAPEVLAVPQGDDGRDAGKLIDRGTLTVLDNQVDPTTGTIKLKASFPNEHLRIWPGAFINVRLKVDTVRDATVVPPAAVQRGPAGPYVYVVNDDLTAAQRAVTLGHEDVSAAIVTAGVTPGERVVVDGASRLTDKAKVTIATPAGATPPPAPKQPEGPTPIARTRGNRGAT